MPAHLLPSDDIVPKSPKLERLTYSPAEAAAVIGISRGRLYQLIEDGTIPSLKLGRRRLIRRDSLDAVLARLEALGGDGPDAAA